MGRMMLFGCINGIFELFCSTQITRVYTNRLGPVFHGCNSKAPVKMDIGDQRYPDLITNRTKCFGGCHIRYGDPNQFTPCLLKLMNLCNRSVDIGSISVGHRLDRYLRISPNGNRADVNLSRFSSVYL